MALNALHQPRQSANDNPTRIPRMSISVARAIDNARLYLRHGNPSAYARALAGEHRAQNPRQQRAIEAAIVADATTRLFTQHAGNGCLLAVEG